MCFPRLCPLQLGQLECVKARHSENMWKPGSAPLVFRSERTCLSLPGRGRHPGFRWECSPLVTGSLVRSFKDWSWSWNEDPGGCDPVWTSHFCWTRTLPGTWEKSNWQHEDRSKEWTDWRGTALAHLRIKMRFYIFSIFFSMFPFFDLLFLRQFFIIFLFLTSLSHTMIFFQVTSREMLKSPGRGGNHWT